MDRCASTRFTPEWAVTQPAGEKGRKKGQRRRIYPASCLQSALVGAIL